MEKLIPDKWVVVTVNFVSNTEQDFSFILSDWKTDELLNNNIRRSSSIKTVHEFDDRYEFATHTGSEYVCYKSNYGYTLASVNMLGAIELQGIAKYNVVVDKTYQTK